MAFEKGRWGREVGDSKGSKVRKGRYKMIINEMKNFVEATDD